jgi:ABC-type lipoprotein export system ATPase subunit
MLAAGPLRLTITMALIHRPAILFFDKPIVGLDVQSAQVIIGGGAGEGKISLMVKRYPAA